MQNVVDKELKKESRHEYSVRLLEEGDLERAIDVWSASFGFMDRDRWRMFALDVSDFVVAGYANGVLASLATVINFDAHLGEKWVRMGGIAGVACDPPYRRQGLVRLVLVECLRILHEKRVALSGLWPFSHPFYNRMGWAVTDMQHMVTHDLSSLKTDGDSSAYRSIRLCDLDEVMPIHDRFVETNNLSMKRTTDRWERQLSRPERSYFLYVHDDGYMLWNIKDPRDRTLEVVEWAFLSERAFMDGLALLKNAGQLHYDRASFVVSDLDPLLKLGVSFPVPKIETRPGMMTRVVHLDAFMEALSLDDFRPEVNDPLGITGSSKSKEAVGPGELVQIATGFFGNAPEGEVKRLYRKVGGRPAFSIEQY